MSHPSLRAWLAAACLLAAFAAAGTAARAQSTDPHQVYEARCARFHEPHAGDFARGHLERREGALVGRASGRDLEAMLDAGHGRTDAAEAEALIAQFDAILHSGGVFQDKCLICHDPAVVLARTKLALRDGRLVGRYSGRDIADFLQGHGRLAPEEVPVVLDMLARQLATGGG